MSFLVEERIESIKKQFHDSSDIGSRLLNVGQQVIGFVFLKSMTNSQIFIDGVYEPISRAKDAINFDSLQNKILKSNDVIEVDETEFIENINKGAIILLLEGQAKALAIDIQFYPTRTPTEPPTSPVIMGPREGFVEDLKTNISLMRRRLATKDLVLKQMSIGKYSSTKVVISYISGIANDKIVKQVESRLKEVEIDGIIDSYYLISFLQERQNSIFRQVGMAEKPDIIASKLLEGKVAILVDNSPIVLTVPFILFEDLQNSNDYYTNHHYSSFIRGIRLIGIFMAIIAAGLCNTNFPLQYIAVKVPCYNC